MERIKPQNKTQVPQKVATKTTGSVDHDETGKFAKGNLASVGGNGNKADRRLTQALISFLHEEVKEGKGKTAISYTRIRRCFQSLYTIATSSNVTPETRLETLKFMFLQVDGPLPKTAPDEAVGDRTIRFTLNVGNSHAADDMSDRNPMGPVINGTVIDPGANGHDS